MLKLNSGIFSLPAFNVTHYTLFSQFISSFRQLPVIVRYFSTEYVRIT